MTIPYALILFRLLMVPIIVTLAYVMGPNAKIPILIVMYLGLFSDILDGIIARKQNISSEKLRRMDSQVDMLFWLSIGFATWLMYPDLISENAAMIASIIGLELICYGISLIKFKKETCTHAFLSKIWGLALVMAFTSLIGFQYAGYPFTIAIVIGFISYVDVILILLILPKWAHDIPSSYHAYLIKKGIEIKRNQYLNG